ncbi:HlyD family type I secretion periplasmic adaptor subunit [Herbaspirillum sp. C7C8]|uniref:HlyD family type I secretion periplasmic adaptor subunit n=1 Tax=Herbaspirillum sp. C7C8 TaxID=2736665 RepID=UPI001F5294AE|nr:HlyD family type I secretion periplasmic adaptor subunit [Herbaspirillum sp. C7C8]MCI1003251.1 HlyD family type I secretion periplasmic adaptor subunit [Herbaspirillum sp. C7C8]
MKLLQWMAAWRALWQRYLGIFLHFWRVRKNLRTDYYNQQEAQFLPGVLALQESPASPTLRWTGRILMSLVAFFFLWAIFGRIDIIVHATGKIIPSSRTKTIASIDVASVKALHVVEGQTVKAGELLIELDSSSSDAEHDKAADAVAQARLQLARANALREAVASGANPKLPQVPAATAAQWEAAQRQLESQYRDVKSKLDRLDDEIVRYGAALPLARQLAEDYQSLLADNTVSRHAWQEKEQARIELQGQLADARNQRSALIAQTLKEAHDEGIDASKRIEAGLQDQRRAGEHSKLLKLVAPVSGTVQQLNVHTVGGVVPAAQPLMQIVPQEAAVEVEAFLENKDIGFVQVGQDAKVKIEAFDYTRYGTVPATVRHVSHDAIEDEKRGLIYASKIVLSRHTLAAEGRTLALAPGMSVTVEIRTGTRRVIEYVLSPLIRHQQESLNER